MQRRLAAVPAALLLATAAARAGDEGASPDPYAAALARVRSIEGQLVAAVDTVCQSSVTVLNRQIPKEAAGQPVSREPRLAGGGSGVIVSRGGKTYVLTNHHVIDGADKLEVVTRDGVTRPVELADTVQQYDIALLTFSDKKVSGLKAVPVVGRKSAELDEGQWCIATGNPFFLAEDGAPVVTVGVISGLDRVLHGNFTYGRAIQHDAAVNPGNSGGPLWNLKGEFVGINGMITFAGLARGQTASNTGAAYAIPVEEIDAFLGLLTDVKKDAQAGFLGVRCETATDQAGKAAGARVTVLDPRSPARGPKGLQPNDVIVSLSISGKQQQVRTGSDLTNALSLCPAGSRVTISYRRLGKLATWSGELAAQ